MEEQTKKIVSISIVVICLILTVVIAQSGDSVGGKAVSSIAMKCVFEDCDGVLTMSVKKYNALMDEMYPGKRSAMDPPLVQICPTCGEESCTMAIKCEKCSSIFFRNTAEDSRYSDTCPDCGYSSMENRSK